MLILVTYSIVIYLFCPFIIFFLWMRVQQNNIFFLIQRTFTLLISLNPYPEAFHLMCGILHAPEVVINYLILINWFIYPCDRRFFFVEAKHTLSFCIWFSEQHRVLSFLVLGCYLLRQGSNWYVDLSKILTKCGCKVVNALRSFKLGGPTSSYHFHISSKSMTPTAVPRVQ